MRVASSRVFDNWVASLGLEKRHNMLEASVAADTWVADKMETLVPDMLRNFEALTSVVVERTIAEQGETLSNWEVQEMMGMDYIVVEQPQDGSIASASLTRWHNNKLSWQDHIWRSSQEEDSVEEKT